MADGERPEADDLAGIDYPALVQAALVDVVRQVLARAAAAGLPGEHHFLLSFGTGEEGVSVPEHLRRRYPDELTIVLQHQFWGLEVDTAGFAVTLRFGGVPERLVVPWTALRTFADPSVGFGLRLRPAQGGAQTPSETGEATPAARASAEDPPAADASAENAPAEAVPAEKVVDFHAFLRKGGSD